MKCRLRTVVLSNSLLLLAACSNDPEQYRLSNDQLAWQHYQVNDVLRFGNSQSAQVRTYRITNLQDQMVRQYTGASMLPLPRKKYDCQQVTVTVQRTDSAATAETALNLELYYTNSIPEIALQAEVGWDKFYPYARLPLDEINQGLPIDTLQFPGITLLPTVTLGPTAYRQVVRATYLYTASAPTKGTRRLYYAKNYGVVGFVEGNTLWYRLP